MDNVKQKVIDMSGKEVGSVELNGAIFAAPINENLVHETVRWQLAKRRAGTHSTLSRSMMKGGGKKPFKQKGTGNARAGSIISPIWVGGAVVFGPHPRDYSYRLPKRTRKQALCSVLTEKAQQGKLVVLDNLTVDSGKTKDMAALIEKLGLQDQSVLMVVSGTGSEAETKLVRSTRNLECVTAMPVTGVNCHDLLRHSHVLIARDALGDLEKRVNH